jgi:hypothetical protein
MQLYHRRHLSSVTEIFPMRWCREYRFLALACSLHFSLPQIPRHDVFAGWAVELTEIHACSGIGSVDRRRHTANGESLLVGFSRICSRDTLPTRYWPGCPWREGKITVLCTVQAVRPACLNKSYREVRPRTSIRVTMLVTLRRTSARFIHLVRSWS